jgi:hypothetical protein
VNRKQKGPRLQMIFGPGFFLRNNKTILQQIHKLILYNRVFYIKHTHTPPPADAPIQDTDTWIRIRRYGVIQHFSKTRIRRYSKNINIPKNQKYRRNIGIKYTKKYQKYWWYFTIPYRSYPIHIAIPICNLGEVSGYPRHTHGREQLVVVLCKYIKASLSYKTMRCEEVSCNARWLVTLSFTCCNIKRDDGWRKERFTKLKVQVGLLD